MDDTRKEEQIRRQKYYTGKDMEKELLLEAMKKTIQKK